MTPEENSDNFLGALAYGFGWLSAIYFINVKRRAVRWHALQSIVVFGGLMFAMLVADMIFPAANPATYQLHVLSMEALFFVSVALWVLLPLQTFRGKPFLVPIFAPLTKMIAGEPPWLQPAEPPGTDASNVPDASGANTGWSSSSASSNSSAPCGGCGGTGQILCSVCAGRGSWWEQPTTATGSPQLQHCNYCMSSGRVRCPACSGTGRAQALI